MKKYFKRFAIYVTEIAFIFIILVILALYLALEPDPQPLEEITVGVSNKQEINYGFCTRCGQKINSSEDESCRNCGHSFNPRLNYDLTMMAICFCVYLFFKNVSLRMILNDRRDDSDV